MTQEEKQILIKYLCAILPYSVWGLHRGEDLPLYIMDNSGAYMVLGYNAWFDLDTVPFKPYLRPMSSMTEEEMRAIPKPFKVQPNGRLSSFDVDFALETDIGDVIEITDWLNAHHFDYRSLIEKELALEAPEDMYKNE